MFRTQYGMAKWVFYKTLNPNLEPLTLLTAYKEQAKIDSCIEQNRIISQENMALKSKLMNAVDKIINTPKTGNVVECVYLSSFDYTLLGIDGSEPTTFQDIPIALAAQGSYLKTGFGDVYV